MFKPSLCDHRDANIFVSGTITVKPQAEITQIMSIKKVSIWKL